MSEPIAAFDAGKSTIEPHEWVYSVTILGETLSSDSGHGLAAAINQRYGDGAARIDDSGIVVDAHVIARSREPGR